MTIEFSTSDVGGRDTRQESEGGGSSAPPDANNVFGGAAMTGGRANNDPQVSVQLVSASSWTLGTQGLTLIGAVLGSVMTARAFGAAGKGELSLLAQLTPLAVTLFGLGLNTANAFFIGRRRHSIAELVSDSLAVAAVVAPVGMILCWLFLRNALPALHGTSRGLLFAAIVPFPFTYAHYLMTGTMNGLGRIKTVAVANGIAAGAVLLVIATAFFAHRLSIGLVLVANAGSALCLAITYFSLLVIRAERRLVTPSFRRIRAQSKYSIRAYLGSLANYLERRQDVFLLGMLSTPGAVGVYSVGTAISELLWQLPRASANALMTKSMQVGEEHGAAIAGQAARITGLLIFLLAAILSAGAIAFVVPVFGHDFGGATDAFLVLIPGTIIYGVGLVLWNHLAAHDQLVPWVALAATGINLSLNVILIPRIGYIGAAAASTASYSFAGVAYTFYFQKLTGLTWDAILLPTTADLRLLAGVVMRLSGVRNIVRQAQP